MEPGVVVGGCVVPVVRSLVVVVSVVTVGVIGVVYCSVVVVFPLGFNVEIVVMDVGSSKDVVL